MSDKLLNLRILTVDGTVYDGPVQAVFLPSVQGRFEVLPMHAPVICSLESGSVEWRLADGRQETLSVTGGAVMINDNVVTVCAQVG